MMIGAAVFVAIFCGQPDLLTVLCLYLWAVVGIFATVIHADRRSDAPGGDRPLQAN